MKKIAEGRASSDLAGGCGLSVPWPAVPTTDRHPRRRPKSRLLHALLAAGFALAGLPPIAMASAAEEQTTDSTLLVLAAASLTDVLPRVADAWVRSGRTAPTFSFDATSRLANQALANPSADVFVAADLDWMQWLEMHGRVVRGAPALVASNELVVVVPLKGPVPQSPPDLRAAGRLALAGEHVPAARYARAALEAAGVWAALEPQVVRAGSVRGVLEWVARGSVPAGVVYRTDALASSSVRVAFVLDPATHPPIGYWAAPLATSERGNMAEAFTAFLASPEAQAAFAEAGFGPPRPKADTGIRPSPVQPPSIWSAVRLSLLVALLATVLGFVPAVGLGWLLARREFPGKAVLSTVVMAPLVMPPVVTGFLLLSAFGANTAFGGALAAMGLSVSFTLVGAALAAFVVGMPLYVISIRGAFEAVDAYYEELSWTLGSPPRRTFFRVSLPLALPGIAAGAVLAFARALGEFGATIVLAGNIEGSTRTIALAVYTLLESPAGQETVWTLVAASVAISMLALLGFEYFSRQQKRRLEDRHVR
jgi:molybdate transport system permease protein